MTPEFWLLDLDRCLINTEMLTDLFFAQASRQTGITLDELRQARRRTEQAGGSFNAVSYLEQRLPPAAVRAALENIERGLIAEAAQLDCLRPGAADFLARLDRAGRPYGILSYGGQRWQRLKLRAAGLGAIPALITSETVKARLVASWQLPDGGFMVPAELTGDEPRPVRSVVLVDDKAANFIGLPDGARGYHVPSTESAATIPAGLSGRVRRVASLNDIDV